MKPRRQSGNAHNVHIATLRLDQYDAILDTRSPGEFADDHLPGALSVPVLDDEERARIGYLYKQVSPFEARRLGAALVARNISRHIETAFSAHGREWRPLVYCWRGGKRSAALTHVLREVGWDADVLEGGYRAYRRHVVERLSVLPRTLRFRVVQGATGSGKSRLLVALRRLGAQVLDLEDLAAHRGSVLGGLPGREQPTQKRFESLVLSALESFDPALPVYVEGESRKIGQVQLTETLIASMRGAECVVLDTELDVRVALLLDEYRHFFHDSQMLEAKLEHLVSLHGRTVIDDWKLLARSADWPGLVSRLLREHYDPAYRKSAARNFTLLGAAPRLRITAQTAAAFDAAAAELLGTQLPPSAPSAPSSQSAASAAPRHNA